MVCTCTLVVRESFSTLLVFYHILNELFWRIPTIPTLCTPVKLYASADICISPALYTDILHCCGCEWEHLERHYNCTQYFLVLPGPNFRPSRCDSRIGQTVWVWIEAAANSLKRQCRGSHDSLRYGNCKRVAFHGSSWYSCWNIWNRHRYFLGLCIWFYGSSIHVNKFLKFRSQVQIGGLKR